MIFYRILLIFSLLLSISEIKAQKFKAGQIEIEQLSLYTIEVNIEIYTDNHDDLVSLPLCWGDGQCASIPLLEMYEIPELYTNYHHFRGLYTYNEPGAYVITVSDCCWDINLANIPSVLDPEFKLEAAFLLSAQGQDFFHSPTYQIGPLVSGSINSLITYDPLLEMNSADSIYVEIVEIEVDGYFFPEEFWPDPNSQILLDETNSSFVWLSPPPIAHQYILKTINHTFQNGIEKSWSERYILIQTNLNTSTTELGTHQLNIYPNPVKEWINIENIPFQNTAIPFSIYNQGGQLVHSGQLTERGLNIKQLSNGLFFLVLDTVSKTYTISFVVKD